jgi:hypothetical protein
MLACMAGIANSAGGQGMMTMLRGAENKTVRKDELSITRQFLFNYVLSDAKMHSAEAMQLIKFGFGEESGTMPGQVGLNHHARPVRLLLEIFPLAAVLFLTVGLATLC